MNGSGSKIAIPSIIWVLLVPLGIIVVFGGIILGFEALATVDGVASIAMLIAGYFCFRLMAQEFSDGKKNSDNPIFIGLVIAFYALMGMAIDQTGNYLYNKPLEILFCPPNTSISRDVDVYNIVPGETNIVQNYQCHDSNGNVAGQIDLWPIMGIRFLEYVVLGYILYYLCKFVPKKPAKNKS